MTMRKALTLTMPLVILGAVGCAPMDSRETESAEATMRSGEAQAREAAIARREATLNRRESAMMSSGAGNSNDLLPPARPGECYARAMTPAQYKTVTKKVLKQEASQKIDITPAEYKWVEERVKVQDATSKLVVVPETYKMAEERIMVKPARQKVVQVPAKYKTVTEKIVEKPAHTVWKRGTGPITRIDNATGEIMCLVEVPATYKTVSKKVLVSPAQTKVAQIPAEYKVVKRKVVATPATTRTVTAPAQYKTVKVLKMVKPASEKRTPIPAVYGTVTSKEKVVDGKLAWVPVLCETNFNAGLVRELQTSLRSRGYNPGPIDGVIGRETMTAVRRYQAANNLPADNGGAINIETLVALGVWNTRPANNSNMRMPK